MILNLKEEENKFKSRNTVVSDLVSAEVSAKTAFPRALRVNGREALGKAETERSGAETEESQFFLK